MRALWISSVAWESEGKYDYEVNGPGAVSGSLFQQEMISGLETQGLTVDIIADYPYKGVKIKRSRYVKHSGDSNDIIIPFANVPILGLLLKRFWIGHYVRKKIKETSYDYVIAYLIHSPFIFGIKTAKKLKKNIRSFLICPDLPDMMDLSLEKKPLKKLLKSVDGLYLSELYKYVDNYVLFAEKMKEKLPINEKPYCIIEGAANLKALDVTPVQKKKAIMHAGTLHRNIGIENILESMRFLPKDMELWIFGDGDLKTYIIEKAKEDKRIKFFGFKSREEVFKYEKAASILINARNSKDEFTKYSFPSKTFEYLYSGTPFLTTSLDGIPEEYYKYMYILENNRPETIAESVRKILAYDREIIDNKAAAAKEFIIKEKCGTMQSNKLYNFIMSERGGK